MSRYLKVNFKDNDFSVCVEGGCIRVLEEITSKYTGGITSFKNVIDEYGMDNIRKSILYSSYGEYIAMKSCRLFMIESLDIKSCYSTLEYLDKKIEISLEDTISGEDWNSECCYIDFAECKVYIL